MKLITIQNNDKQEFTSFPRSTSSFHTPNIGQFELAFYFHGLQCCSSFTFLQYHGNRRQENSHAESYAFHTDSDKLKHEHQLSNRNGTRSTPTSEKDEKKLRTSLSVSCSYQLKEFLRHMQYAYECESECAICAVVDLSLLLTSTVI